MSFKAQPAQIRTSAHYRMRLLSRMSGGKAGEGTRMEHTRLGKPLCG